MREMVPHCQDLGNVSCAEQCRPELDQRSTTLSPRSWEVAGLFVDVLGEVETLARTPFNEVQASYGVVKLISPEDLLVERVLISVYPQRFEPAEACARKLIAVGLAGQVEIDWDEVRRLASRPEYNILQVVEKLAAEVAHELGKESPYHS